MEVIQFSKDKNCQLACDSSICHNLKSHLYHTRPNTINEKTISPAVTDVTRQNVRTSKSVTNLSILFARAFLYASCITQRHSRV
jgi:hypothetical protein